MAPRADRPAEHDCEWRGRAEALEASNTALGQKLEVLAHEFETLKRRLLGPKSEKMPGVEKELRGGTPVDPKKIQAKRRERAKAKQALEKKTTVHPVPAAQQDCPSCGGHDFHQVGDGKESVVYEYKPARFVAHRHLRQTMACKCGEYVVTAESPAKWVDKSQYAPSFVAHLITAKCADSIPLYRLEKEYQRIGVPISRSTMNDLFHRAAELLAPLAARLVMHVRLSEIVRADETSQKVLAAGKCHTGFIWTFRARVPEPLITYVFAPSRSGETAQRILGGTTGALVIDGYTGYNKVLGVDGRTRIGCHAHVRRYFFDALEKSPAEGRKGLDFILGLYRIEHDALAEGIIGTPEHLERRKTRAGRVREAFKAWLEEQRPLHPPKSPIGQAISYTINQWPHLGHFLNDVRIPLDNNESESALRRVAMGRKNFLFVGHDKAGENLAGLYSLVATCEANGVNPVEYLEDVLMRISNQADKIDDLLPHRWRGPPGPVPATG